MVPWTKREDAEAEVRTNRLTLVLQICIYTLHWLFSFSRINVFWLHWIFFKQLRPLSVRRHCSRVNATSRLWQNALKCPLTSDTWWGWMSTGWQRCGEPDMTGENGQGGIRGWTAANPLKLLQKLVGCAAREYVVTQLNGKHQEGGTDLHNTCKSVGICDVKRIYYTLLDNGLTFTLENRNLCWHKFMSKQTRNHQPHSLQHRLCILQGGTFPRRIIVASRPPFEPPRSHMPFDECVCFEATKNPTYTCIWTCSATCLPSPVQLLPCGHRDLHLALLYVTHRV